MYGLVLAWDVHPTIPSEGRPASETHDGPRLPPPPAAPGPGRGRVDLGVDARGDAVIGAPAARLAALAATLEAVRLAPACEDPRLDGTLARVARALEHCAEALADAELLRLGRSLATGARSSRRPILDAVLVHLAGVPAVAPPRRVLVVDGDEGMRRLHALTLSSPDCTVIGAAGLAEARAALATSSVDLTVLELSLPDGDGRMLLGAGHHQGGAMIVCTAERDVVARTECYALGADAVLLKPCAPEELQACVVGRLARPVGPGVSRLQDASWWTDAGGGRVASGAEA